MHLVHHFCSCLPMQDVAGLVESSPSILAARLWNIKEAAHETSAWWNPEDSSSARGAWQTIARDLCCILNVSARHTHNHWRRRRRNKQPGGSGDRALKLQVPICCHQVSLLALDQFSLWRIQILFSSFVIGFFFNYFFSATSPLSGEKTLRETFPFAFLVLSLIC